jgi:hypothetical protein
MEPGLRPCPGPPRRRTGPIVPVGRPKFWSGGSRTGRHERETVDLQREEEVPRGWVRRRVAPAGALHRLRGSVERQDPGQGKEHPAKVGLGVRRAGWYSGDGIVMTLVRFLVARTGRRCGSAGMPGLRLAAGTLARDADRMPAAAAAGGLTTLCRNPGSFLRAFWTAGRVAAEGNAGYQKEAPTEPLFQPA